MVTAVEVTVATVAGAVAGAVAETDRVIDPMGMQVVDNPVEVQAAGPQAR